jgi:hypothetical protein
MDQIGDLWKLILAIEILYLLLGDGKDNNKTKTMGN